MKKTKKIILGAIIIAIVIGVCGYFAKVSYDKKQEEIRLEKIETKNSEILAEYQSFEKEEDRAKRLALYKDFENEVNQYDKEEDSFDECKENYEKYYSEMKTSLASYYDEKIAEYSKDIVENIEAVEDKEMLNNLISSFTSLKKQMISEQEEYILLSEDEFNSYNEEIDGYITSCNSRLEAIKKTEEEAEVARKKAEEEEAAKKKANSNSNNGSNGSGSNSGNNNGNGTNSSTNNMKWNVFWTENEDGSINQWKEYVDGNGNAYDENGNYLYNKNDWGMNY